MPLQFVRTTPGAFSDDARSRLVEALTEAACRAERIPDDPLLRLRSIVFWDEAPEGSAFAGGLPAGDLARAVFITLIASDGVLDPVTRARFAADAHDAVLDAASASGDDDRVVASSVIFGDVPEGRWGRNGAIVRLPEMASTARFEHLAEVAVDQPA